MVDKKGKISSNWVCPNDRQLMLRAQLSIGWSVKAQQFEKFGSKPVPLTQSEQQIIADVIKRAEALDNQEQERIGHLVERVDNMKKYALGSGTKQCVLCGEKFRFLTSSSLYCHDCQKLVCSKCGVDVTSSSKKEKLWLCKICAETREMWKKSGAWFYKSLPKYVLPKSTSNSFCDNYRVRHPDNMWTSVSARNSQSTPNDNDSSSEDELKLIKSVPTHYSSSNNIISATSVNSSKSSKDRCDTNSRVSTLAPIMTNISISNTNSRSATSTPRSKYNPEQPFRREGSSESGSSRTQSTESGGFLPHIYINHCDNESTTLTRDFSESDKTSLSSGISISGHHGFDDFPEDLTPAETLAKGPKRDEHKWSSRPFLQAKLITSWRKVVSFKNPDRTKNGQSGI